MSPPLPAQPTPPRSSRASSPDGECHKGTRMEIKRVDKACIQGEWKLFDGATPLLGDNESQYAKYAEYAIILRRKLQQTIGKPDPDIITRILIQSEELLKVVKEVMKDVRKISWSLRPCKLDPESLIAYLPQLREARTHRLSKVTSADEDPTIGPLSLLINLLETEFATTIYEINTLVSNGEISFDLIWSIFLPHSLVYTTCPTTSEPRLVRLVEIVRAMNEHGVPFWALTCEFIDAYSESEPPRAQFRLRTMNLAINGFKGVVKIPELNAYPLTWHSKQDEIRRRLTERGRKWADLNGTHHLHYEGMAYRREPYPEQLLKVKVNGRVMVDRTAFRDVDPNHPYVYTLDENTENTSNSISDPKNLSDEDLLIATPILYGFSLTDKLWVMFNVTYLRPIRWNNDVFENVAIDNELKVLVQSLVESHSRDNPFDDFVEGKGLGLVFNLFGPPGVGKSLTVEATSEHLRKPFYVVGGGDLGTNASNVDFHLQQIFSVAARWKAVVLIDEADVFLEERQTDHLERNAMVAVFLRQIEYFRGILFLTTNRVTAFDPAFQSRIHLSLEYKELAPAAKAQIWQAFLAKASKGGQGTETFTADEMDELANKPLNGRQIKNVVKLALALSDSEKQPLNFKHLIKIMDIMARSTLR